MISGFEHNLGAIAGGVIFLGLVQVVIGSELILVNRLLSGPWVEVGYQSSLCDSYIASFVFVFFLQIFGIVMACFVALYKRNEEGKYNTV